MRKAAHKINEMQKLETPVSSFSKSFSILCVRRILKRTADKTEDRETFMKHSIKTRICIAAVLFLSVLFSGCEYTSETPLTVTADQTEAITNSFAEKLVGIYKTHSEENGETIMQIYLIQDQLIAEIEEEYAAYYAMEWTVADSSMNDNGTARKDFTVHSFSGFSNFGAYWDTVRQITVTLTDTGFTLEERNGITTEYMRDNTADPIHIPEKYIELFQDTADTSLAGTWTASTDDGYNMFLQLDSEGNLIWCCKKEGEPIEFHIGIAAAYPETGTIQTISERVGWAQMPWQYDLDFSYAPDGKLTLRNIESDGLLPTDHEIVFYKQTDKE